MNILALDPGVTTGVAMKSEIGYHTLEVRDTKQLWLMVSCGSWDQVIVENFVAQDIYKYGLHTVRLIGNIEALCWARKIPFTTQQNVQRLPYKDRALTLLKAIHEGKKPPRDHELDSPAHILCWEANHAVT